MKISKTVCDHCGKDVTEKRHVIFHTSFRASITGPATNEYDGDFCDPCSVDLETHLNKFLKKD